MSTYVLVPGAWLGGFAWERVVPALLDAGHDVRPVTLPGLGNRADEAAEREIGLQDHVDDLVRLVEGQDLTDAVLVGHSYAGIPTSLAALALGDRVRRLVLVDANVPEAGRPFVSEGYAARLQEALDAHGGMWPPLGHDDLQDQDLAHEDVHFFEDWAKPHPGRTLTDPVRDDAGLAEDLRGPHALREVPPGRRRAVAGRGRAAGVTALAPGHPRHRSLADVERARRPRRAAPWGGLTRQSARWAASAAMSAGPSPQHPPTYDAPAATHASTRSRSSGTPVDQTLVAASQVPPRLG